VDEELAVFVVELTGAVEVITTLVKFTLPVTFAVLVSALAFGKLRLTPVLVSVSVSVVFTAAAAPALVVIPLPLLLLLVLLLLLGAVVVVTTVVITVVARLQKLWASVSAEERSEAHCVDMHSTRPEAKRSEEQ